MLSLAQQQSEVVVEKLPSCFANAVATQRHGQQQVDQRSQILQKPAVSGSFASNGTTMSDTVGMQQPDFRVQSDGSVSETSLDGYQLLSSVAQVQQQYPQQLEIDDGQSVGQLSGQMQFGSDYVDFQAQLERELQYQRVLSLQQMQLAQQQAEMDLQIRERELAIQQQEQQLRARELELQRAQLELQLMQKDGSTVSSCSEDHVALAQRMGACVQPSVSGFCDVQPGIQEQQVLKSGGLVGPVPVAEAGISSGGVISRPTLVPASIKLEKPSQFTGKHSEV